VSGVLLALLASVAWGTSDFLAGVESRRTTFWAAVLISQPAALLGAAIVLAVHAEAPPSIAYLWPAMLGGILSARAAVAQYRALTLIPMSLVSPLFAAAAVVPVLWGVAHGERPSPLQATGMVLTLAGIVLISRQGPEAPGEPTMEGPAVVEPAAVERAAADPPAGDPAAAEPATSAAGPAASAEGPAASAEGPATVPAAAGSLSTHSASVVGAAVRSAAVCTKPPGMTPARARREGILLALAAGIGFGLLLVSFDYGGDADEYWTVSAARLTAVLVGLATIGMKRPSLQLRRTSAPVLVLVGLLLVGANVLFTAASTRGFLSVVAVLGWLSPAFTVAYAAIFLHERLRPLQWLAAASVFAGVVCLAAG